MSTRTRARVEPVEDLDDDGYEDDDVEDLDDLDDEDIETDDLDDEDDGVVVHLDLDEAIAEADDDEEPLLVRFGGEVWELPGSPPASVTLRVAKWNTDGLVDDQGRPVKGSKLKESHYLLLIGDLLPRDVRDEWSARGWLSTNQLPTICEFVLKQYRARTDKLNRAARRAAAAKAPKARKAAAGRRPSRTSSSTGGGSKRTSTASTRSTRSSRS